MFYSHKINLYFIAYVNHCRRNLASPLGAKNLSQSGYREKQHKGTNTQRRIESNRFVKMKD